MQPGLRDGAQNRLTTADSHNTLHVDAAATVPLQRAAASGGQPLRGGGTPPGELWGPGSAPRLTSRSKRRIQQPDGVICHAHKPQHNPHTQLLACSMVTARPPRTSPSLQNAIGTHTRLSAPRSGLTCAGRGWVAARGGPYQGIRRTRRRERYELRLCPSTTGVLLSGPG